MVSSTRQRADYGTPELARRFSVVPKLSMSSGYNGKVIDDTEIDRLLMKDTINSMEHSLLVALFRVLRSASFVGLKSPDFNAISAPDPVGIADRKAFAVRRMASLTIVLDRQAGRAVRCALIDLVLLDRPWPLGPALLHHGILALQNVFAGGQRELKRAKVVDDGIPVWVHGEP
jgi:hypothetical protein